MLSIDKAAKTINNLKPSMFGLTSVVGYHFCFSCGKFTPKVGGCLGCNYVGTFPAKKVEMYWVNNIAYFYHPDQAKLEIDKSITSPGFFEKVMSLKNLD